MPYQNPPTTRLSDKFVGYCAVTPNRKFMKLFERANVSNILISYHYIRQDPAFTLEILEMIRDRGGLFMTDSGIFSFGNDKNFDPNTFDWLSYVEEYTQWLGDNKEYIFSACNLDADLMIGHDKVVEWNEKYFKPLEEHMQIIYVAHPNAKGMGDLDTLKEYCKEHDYVAVNERMAKHAAAIYQEAKISKTAIHGLAWTKPTILTDFPFFSVDSSSWVNYQKFGATPVWDGKNFLQYDKDNKAIRKTLRKQCEKYGIKEYEFINEKNEDTGTHNDDEGLTYSLRTWLDVFERIKVIAKTKQTRTLGQMLYGKGTIFIEDQSAAPAPKIPGGGGGRISGIIADLSLETEEPIPTTYEVHEDGSEVPIYQKRDKRETITEFKEKQGSLMVCNYCHIADKCPKFKQDSVCGFDFAPAETLESPMATIDALIKLQMERVNRAMLIEQMEGGMPNKVFATEMNLLNTLNQTKVNMMLLAQAKGLRIMQNTQTVVELPINNNLPASTPATPELAAPTPTTKAPTFAEILKGIL